LKNPVHFFISSQTFSILDCQVIPARVVSINRRIDSPILIEGDHMDIAKGIERAVVFIVKAYLVLLGLCIGLHVLLCWLSTIHLSSGQTLELWLVLGVASVIAYIIRKRRSLSKDRNLSHHGSERTPLMPRGRGRA